MKLGVLPPQGGSLANLRAAGQADRFIHAYLGHYARHFERVYYFSYRDEAADLPENCTLVKNPGLHRWLYALALPILQRRYFQDCDVLRVMQMTGALPAVIARGLYGTPYAGTYGYTYQAFARLQGMPLRGALFEGRARLGLRWAAGVIVTTPELQAELARRVPAGRLVYLPNGVDTSRFRPPPARQVGAEQRVVFVGRLDPVKNLTLLIDALSTVQAAPIRLEVIGDGPLRVHLEEHAARRGLACEFLGTLPNEQLPARLAAADLFVLPSQREGHPKALLEAMSCALPCIGTDVAGIRQVIQDGVTGLLCSPSVPALADCITRLLADPALAVRLGRAARQYVQANFDLDRLLERETHYLLGLGAVRGRAPGERL